MTFKRIISGDACIDYKVSTPPTRRKCSVCGYTLTKNTDMLPWECPEHGKTLVKVPYP